MKIVQSRPDEEPEEPETPLSGDEVRTRIAMLYADLVLAMDVFELCVQNKLISRVLPPGIETGMKKLLAAYRPEKWGEKAKDGGLILP
jgi:hypothetical protein